MIKIDAIYCKKLTKEQINALNAVILQNKKNIHILEKLLLPEMFAKVKKAV